MSIEYSTIVPESPAEVVAWHRRPGAFPRLLPPWLPLHVVSEAASLADGRAVLGLPLGLHWVAQHHGYVPDRRFVDDLVVPGLAPGRLWSHTHEFTPVEGGHTRVTDRIHTPAPRAVLEATCVYRHRQLADDLAAHAAARRAGTGSLVVAVSGSSGLVGSALCAFLTSGGHRVVRLVRHAPGGPDERRWDPDDPSPDLLDGVDAVVHLAGAPVAGRFTAAHERKVRDSRVGPTRRLAELAARSSVRPGAFVSASGVGFYGPDRGDDVLSEEADRGEGFLAEVVADWEDAVAPAADAGMRTVQVRTGIVQSPRGGMLQVLRPPFLAGLGGPLGSGRQWVSWIGIDDLVDVYHRAVYDDRLRGPVNAVAPEACRNAEYGATLGRVLRRPAVLRVPAWAPALVLGAEGATEFALASQRVTPGVLAALGHRFRHPRLDDALAHVLGRAKASSPPA